MLATRIIPCLDVEDGRVVKGIKFKNIKDAGDPVELAALYNQQGADELIFLDISASYRSREIMIDVMQQVSRQLFIPLTVGGGIREFTDMRRILNAGADKVAICTAAIKNPSLISEGTEKFGSQCIVLSIDAKRDGNSWFCYINGGRVNSGIDALQWAKEGEKLGAGEILLNSIDRDGTKQGYDLELTRSVSELVNIPVIASGGAGTMKQMLDAIVQGKADAVLLASLLHYGEFTIPDIKKYLKDKGVTTR
ncbi:MAG: imidazole glycerol phosphate synthase subunit HisF [bacterium]|nr:MAG: imidazole glycerol phosphate synthase subunit HisF [bacterium]